MNRRFCCQHTKNDAREGPDRLIRPLKVSIERDRGTESVVDDESELLSWALVDVVKGLDGRFTPSASSVDFFDLEPASDRRRNLVRSR